MLITTQNAKKRIYMSIYNGIKDKAGTHLE